MTTDPRGLALVVAVLGLACGGGTSAARVPPPATVPTERGASPAAASPQFRLHPSLTSVCTQHMLLEGDEELAWTLYASPLPLAEVARWYAEQLPASVLETGSAEWTWRLPDAEAPDRVLHLYGPERQGLPGCGTDPPEGTRSVVNLSHLYGP